MFHDCSIRIFSEIISFIFTWKKLDDKMCLRGIGEMLGSKLEELLMAEHPDQVVKTRDTLDNHLLKRYKVIIHNDDYTTFDFVTVIFMNIFGKSLEEAKALTMNVHKTGHGIAGYYIREVAESKVEEVHRAARIANFPLFASYEAC